MRCPHQRSDTADLLDCESSSGDVSEAPMSVKWRAMEAPCEGCRAGTADDSPDAVDHTISTMRRFCVKILSLTKCYINADQDHVIKLVWSELSWSSRCRSVGMVLPPWLDGELCSKHTT